MQNEFAKNNFQKGTENRKIILLWGYRQGFLNEEILQNLLNVKRKSSYEWVKRSVLKKIPNPETGQPFFILHGSVRREAIDLFVDWRPGEDYAKLFRVGKSRIPSKRYLNHAVTTQMVAINVLREAGEPMSSASYMSEIEFRCKYPGSKAVPDFVFTRYPSETDQQQIEWHEIEINGKRNEVLYYQMQTRNDAIRKGRADKIIWHVRSQKIADHIKATLLMEYLPAIEKVNNTFLRSPILDDWSPAKLLAATEFRLLPE